jgi:DNA-binding NtrC family response regulator
VTRLGSLRPKPIDVRFVSATNRSLGDLVAKGAFRQDLYFRLNGIPITIPPLRERASELAGFATRFLERACERASRPSLRISAAAMARLAAHPWPGNLRELKNVMERASVLAISDEIQPEHVVLDDASIAAPVSSKPAAVGASADGRQSLRSELDALERQRIIEALAQCNGNQTKAAALLGTSRRALINRIEAYGLPRPRK